MNLHGIAGPIVATVNPTTSVSLRINIGQSVDAAGKLTPAYAPDVAVRGQVQPITWRDLQMIDGVNLGGVRWKIYLNGEVNAVVRTERKGGDLVVITSGRHQGVWLVAQVLEQFPDWVCAAIVLQESSQAGGDGLTTDLTNPDNNVVVPLILTGV